jgi:hypothetical protein
MNRYRVIAGIGAAWLLASSGAVAATVYRWVDEQGKVHYAEVVPPQYRHAAEPVGGPATEPTAAQQQDALERARKDRVRAAAIGADRENMPASASAASVASRPSGRRPAPTPDDQTDCETWQRLYRDSIECFGPYRTTRGAIRPEGFDVCSTVPEPPPRCRPRLP